MIFVNLLGAIMNFCYNILGNYGCAVILFTLITKILLLPLSIWIQKNSIKMIKIKPDINRIKINYFGDKDKIADEEAKLYKKEKYNAFASLIPLTIQIILLLGVVEVIKNPQDGVNQYFCGINLSWIAVEKKGITLLVPLIAGLSSLILCIAQNLINVLQSEETKLNKYGMLIFSVGLSLYLGAFVPAGVALYWIASNLFAILQQWILNIFINPKKYINYEELEKTNKELKALNDIKNIRKLTKEEKKKSREDYKKFFKVVNKHLVFYSESNGFYKYYKGIIEYILNKTNITIHYITSDFNDQIFELEKENPQVKAYFIDDRKLITLMMKMDADVVVMTMPDLEKYHIKRSYVRKDIEYVYIPHGMDSLNMTMRERSMNYFDTVFTIGPHQYDEMILTNELYKLDNRKIIKWGYTLLDDMIEEYNIEQQNNNSKFTDKKKILIAPSWQKDNIIDLCLEEVLDNLKDENYEITVRPHPQHVRHMREKFDSLKDQYKDNENIIIQTDFSKNDTIFNSDIVITDWSGIAYEYAFTTKKPVIFIDTPMKVMNPEYKKIDIEPFNIWVRNEVGEIVKTDEINTLNDVVKNMLINYKQYQEAIVERTNKSVYNLGTSAKVGGDYIIEAIQNKINERKEN